MGGRGYDAVPKNQKDGNTLKRVPHEKPRFTLKDLKKAIPPHCFNRPLMRSFSYIAYDISVTLILYYIATTYFHRIPSPYGYLAWPVYWVLQGCTFTGVWAIGHESGHHAISDYQIIDDIVGLLVHSFLLVPYFSFKYSHRRHHSNTNSLERDEVYVPKPKSELQWYGKYANNTFGRIVTIILTLTIGWPSYLAFNVSGRSYERFASHYDPYSPIYNDRERLQVYLSDIGVMTMVYALYRVWLVKGLTWIVRIYWVPLIIGNLFVVLITYLQHTHVTLPHYDSSEWEWIKGALATVDRDYGFLNFVFHHTPDTHVVHHLFSTIPHYYANEATNAIKPILGDYYQFDDTPFYKAMWREAKECLYVEPDENATNKGVFWYKNKY